MSIILRAILAAYAHSYNSYFHFIGVGSQLMNGNYIIKLYIYKGG